LNKPPHTVKRPISLVPDVVYECAESGYWYRGEDKSVKIGGSAWIKDLFKPLTGHNHIFIKAYGANSQCEI
jgi:hypothetical protein